MRGSHPRSNSGLFDTSEDGRGQTTFKLYGYRIEPLLTKLTTCEELMARLNERVTRYLRLQKIMPRWCAAVEKK